MGQHLRCPACGEVLGNTNAAGDCHLRTRGIVLQADGTVLVFCKHCRAPFNARTVADQARRSGSPRRMVIPGADEVDAP